MPRRANDLNGVEWTKYSVSIWGDLRKSPEEMRLNHPALFPVQLVERLLRCFTNAEEKVVLDPFAGSGSTLIAARNLGKQGIGLEISPRFLQMAQQRLSAQKASLQGVSGRCAPEPLLYYADARSLSALLPPHSVDICITSPPYWDVLSQKRSADRKEIRDYGPIPGDLGKIQDYSLFLETLVEIFTQVREVLKPGKRLIINVMDLRKKERFFPLHADLIHRLCQKEVGFEIEDLIIWDRRQEYNHLRPLGYPSVFRINKVHEYLLIFKAGDK